jgi:hypothetical protein
MIDHEDHFKKIYMYLLERENIVDLLVDIL